MDCYDATTGLKVFVGMGALVPTNPATPVVISPLSTLAAVASIVGVSEADVKTALGLPSSIKLGQYNALAAFSANPAGPGRKVYTTEVALLNLVNLAAGLMYKPTNDSAKLDFNSLGINVYIALASRVVSDAPGGRRRLSAVAPLDLTDTATIKAVITGVAAIFNDPSAYGPGATYTIPADKLTAAAAGISAINQMAEDATSATGAQKVGVVAQTELATNVAGLGSGAVSKATFTQNASPESLNAQLQAAVLPGLSAPPPPAGAPSGSDGSLSGGAIAGIVIGSVAGAVLICAFAYLAWRRAVLGATGGDPNGASSLPTASMHSNPQLPPSSAAPAGNGQYAPPSAQYAPSAAQQQQQGLPAGY
jgi:hypothetical protein